MAERDHLVLDVRGHPPAHEPVRSRAFGIRRLNRCESSRTPNRYIGMEQFREAEADGRDPLFQMGNVNVPFNVVIKNC